MSNEKSVAMKGGIWTGISTLVTVITSFGRLMILTRFLDKADFGIVSIVNTVIGLCVTFTDLGFSSAIMYKKNISKKEYSTLFWTQLIIFTCLYVILLGLSSWISNFYNQPSLKILIPIAALTVIFQAFGKLYDAILQKQYKFKTIAYRNISTSILSLLIAIILAWKGYGVYSLIFSTLTHSIILNTWNFISGMKMQRIIFYCNPIAVLDLLKIGIFQTGTRIMDFISNKFDVMIIGKLLGVETLGLYDLAKNLVNTFVDLVRTVVSKVALPILSNSNDNDDAVRARFLIMTKVVAYITIPICVGIATFSKEVLWVVYGSTYTDASIIVTLFAFISIFNSICSFYDMLGVAKGRTDLNFYSTVARMLVTIPIVYVTSLVSIRIVAYGQLFSTVIHSFLFWIIVVRQTYPMSFSYYFSHFSKWLFVQLGCYAIMRIIMTCINVPELSIWRISISFIAYVLIMIGSMFFVRKDIVYFKNLLKS